MSTLFISHSSRDNNAAKELQTRLEEQGHRSVFLDLDPEAGIQAGVSWERTLYTKLRACRAVVALCSDTYLASQWCFAEIALARMEGKELFVLQIDPWSEGTQMPSILTEEQFIDLRTKKDEGYRRLWNGFKVKGIVPAEAREWKPDEPPYPGLRAFREEDAPIFFGRDEEIRSGGELLNRVRRQGHPRLVMVLGSSGSGKSSLVRAGIVPQLRRDRNQWLVVKPFRPGRQPARELAASLSRAFNEAGQAFTWEEIHGWLEPAADGSAAPTAELLASAEAEPSPAVARERLLQALSAMEAELADVDTVASSMRRLQDYLGEQQAESPLPAGGPPPPSVPSPLAELASRLRLQSGFSEAAVVLVIDQFEELLGHDGEHPGSRFLATLRAAMEVEDSPLLVIGTMRSDYLGVLQRSAPLQGLGFKSLSVGPMSRDGMRRVIEEPAQLGGIQLEEGLSDLLLEDTETSDALPLLAFTLRMMWDRYRDQRLLEIREYKDFGRLQGAIAQVADETFEDELEKVQDEDARDVLEREMRDAFLGMARPAAEGSGWSRRPVSWDQLSETVRPALEPFIDPQRLLVKRPDGTVEVAHEALFRSWDRLKGWLDENAEGLYLLREIQTDAAKWDEAETEEDKEPYLWRGGRLVRALELQRAGVLPLQDLDRAFVEASDRAERAAAEAEEARRRGELRRARIFAAVVGGAFLIAAGLGTIAYLARKEAERQAAEARNALRISAVERLAADRANGSTAHSRIGLLREVEAEDPALIPGWAKLTGEALMEPVTETILRGPEKKTVSTAVFSTDGDRLLTAYDDGTSRVWNVDLSGEPVLFVGPDAAVRSAAFAPGGERIATAFQDGTARLWNADGKGPPTLLEDHTEAVVGIAFSPDGKRVVTASEDKTARVWTDDGSVVLRGHEEPLTHAAFSPDGTRVVTAAADGTARVWSAVAPGEAVALRGHEAPLTSVAFSPDGGRIVTASEDQKALLWSADGSSPPIELKGHGASVHSAVFGPGGKRVATSSLDGTVRVWDVDGKSSPLVLQAQDDSVFAAVFSPDGKRIVSSSNDKTARVWNSEEEGEAIVLEGHTYLGSEASFSPDSERLVMGYDDGTARVWNPEGSGTPIVLEGPDPDPIVLYAAFSPDGERILSVYANGEARAWKADGTGEVSVLRAAARVASAAAFSADGKRLVLIDEDGTARVSHVDGSGPTTVLEGQQGVISAVALSSDGERLATADWDGSVRVRNANGSGEAIALEGHSEAVSCVAFSRDGKRVVTASYDGTARVWSTNRESAPLAVLPGDETGVPCAAFSPDGQRLVTTSGAGTLKVWNRTDGSDEPLELEEGHRDSVHSAVFGPRGERLATASDFRAQVWNADGSGEPIVFRGPPEIEIAAAAFAPDGRRILTTQSDGTIRVWQVPDVASLWWATQACPTVPERRSLLGQDEETAGRDFERCREMVRCLRTERGKSFRECYREFRRSWAIGH